MTTLEAKSEARRQAWIRAEALRISSAIEAQKIVDLVAPNIQDKLRDWIRLEVIQAMKNVRVQVLADVKEHVKGEVANYCRSVFDSQSMEEDHFHMVQEQSDLPPILGLGTRTDQFRTVQEEIAESHMLGLPCKHLSNLDDDDRSESDEPYEKVEEVKTESNLLAPDALLV